MSVSCGALLRTLWRLGPRNVAAVAIYRAALVVPWSRIRRLRPLPPTDGVFFRATVSDEPLPPVTAWQREGRIFGWLPIRWEPHRCPDWLTNPLTGATLPLRPWWELSDADTATGDIKAVWDLSRFDWAVAFAQRGHAGSAEAWAALNDWLADWEARNPAYLGPNWKCGQEASLRVLHLATAAAISRQVASASDRLLRLVATHLRRIEPTWSYARAQNNNHGTSEAAALFVGGSWLAQHGHAGGAEWAARGRAALEERVLALVDRDGSFSQYSVNYQRLLLDTLSIAEVWRRTLQLADWSAEFRVRAAAATEWLWRLVDAGSGDAPNIGANDGSLILPLADCDVRDHRPAVARAAALFLGRSCYPTHGASVDALRWLAIPRPEIPLAPAGSHLCAGGGFGVLRRGATLAVVRIPRYRFRPSQEDALHVDLWHDGENLLRDAGTFGYLASEADLALFAGVAGHNVVQVDGRPQMPRVGRFLLADWWPDAKIETWDPEASPATLAVEAEDRHRTAYVRRVELEEGCLTVRDAVGPTARECVWRWRLRPAAWEVHGRTASDGRHVIEVASEAPVTLHIGASWESRYYQRRTPAPVLHVTLAGPGELVTRYRCQP